MSKEFGQHNTVTAQQVWQDGLVVVTGCSAAKTHTWPSTNTYTVNWTRYVLQQPLNGNSHVFILHIYPAWKIPLTSEENIVAAQLVHLLSHFATNTQLHFISTTSIFVLSYLHLYLLYFYIYILYLIVLSRQWLGPHWRVPLCGLSLVFVPMLGLVPL